jgi:hypothetical protein
VYDPNAIDVDDDVPSSSSRTDTQQQPQQYYQHQYHPTISYAQTSQQPIYLAELAQNNAPSHVMDTQTAAAIAHASLNAAVELIQSRTPQSSARRGADDGGGSGGRDRERNDRDRDREREWDRDRHDRSRDRDRDRRRDQPTNTLMISQLPDDILKDDVRIRKPD